MLITSIIPRLMLPLLVTMVFLTACAGDNGGGSNGGGSGGGPGVTLAPFTNVNLTITPSYVNADSRGNFTIKLNNYRSLPGGIENININAIGGGGNWGDSLSLSEIRESEGEFVISISGPEGRYTITVTIAYTNGSIVSDFPIVFVNEQNREDYEAGGIYLGSNYDGDLQADEVDGDDDNDGIADELDTCDDSPRGWESNRSNDTDTDGCRDRDEDISLAGVTNLDKVASSGQVVLTWTNPTVAIGHINISWQEKGVGHSDSIEKQGDVMSGMSSNHTIPGLTDGTTYTFTVVVHYANGGVSEPTTIEVLVGADGGEDTSLAGVTNLDKVVSPGQVVLTWTNPDVAIDHINISWQEKGVDNSDSVEKRDNVVSGMSSSHTISGLTSGISGITYTFTVVVHYADGRVSVATTIDVLVDADGDNDGVLNMNEVDGCETKPDCDGDSHNDAMDVDDDGDGLIEITTPAELDAVRYQLDGTGRKLSATATVDDTGCGNGTDSGDITACHGYELANNISLTGYIAETYPADGWLPIGYDISRSEEFDCEHGPSGFSAIFEGNNFVISGLSIDRSDQNCIGLFTYLTETGEVSRLGLKADEIRGHNRVGSLAAFNKGTIDSSYVVVTSLEGAGNAVGGLVGQHGDIINADDIAISTDADISSSYAVISSLTGKRSVGGLIGRSIGESNSRVPIDYSYAIIDSITGDTALGGLVGTGRGTTITSSYAIFNTSEGKHYVGGLVGGSVDLSIVSSYAIFNSLTAESSIDDGGVGGLVGQASRFRVTSSYVIVNSLAGDDHVGGFISNISSGSVEVDSSYGVFGPVTRNPSLNTDTLIGSSQASATLSISNSYWNSDTTNLATGTHGQPQPGSELTGPMDYGGIYDSWDTGTAILTNHRDIDNITVYCDSDHSGSIESSEQTDNNKIWDFGTAAEYPAIRCTPNTPADQRNWWSLNSQGQPMLNQDRLDEYFP